MCRSSREIRTLHEEEVKAVLDNTSIIIREIISIKSAPFYRRFMLKFTSSRARWLFPGALMHLIEKRFAK